MYNVPQVNQGLLTVQGNLFFSHPGFRGVRFAQYLVFCVHLPPLMKRNVGYKTNLSFLNNPTETIIKI
jgi:hypothetical protein